MLETLKSSIYHLGKPSWRPMLSYLAHMHERALHAPFLQLPHLWEEVAPGQFDGQLFGGWETVHIALDTLYAEPEHARDQIFNCLALQGEEGFVPGWVYLDCQGLRWSDKVTFPPLWSWVLEDFYVRTGERDTLAKAYDALCRQIQWFERHRKTERGAFYYLDILDNFCESGVKEGRRFDQHEHMVEDLSCVDATAHLYSLYNHAASWSEFLLVEERGQWRAKAEALRFLLQREFFDEDTGFFYDPWRIHEVRSPLLSFEGIWPFVVGAASQEQALRIVEEHLLAPQRFYAAHPVPSLALEEEGFCLQSWRGPTRNSMTYWAARGCVQYGYRMAAIQLLENALDRTAEHFQKTGTLWEFYHPHGRSPQELDAPRPCRDHLGHNPLLAMSELWKELTH